MDSIVKIKQVITSLENKVEDKDARILESLLTDLGEKIQDRDDAYTIVRMMQSTTRYLVSRTSTVHPDTVPLLSSLAGNLVLLLSDPPPSKEAAQKTLVKSIQAFKALKSCIAVLSPLSKVELEELKAVILSVDWEISSFTLKSFDKVITRLKEKVKSNKLHYTFLRIMHSIGGYIARNKAAVDKNSINLLQSVFLNYEKLIQNPEMPIEEKKQMIESDIKAYNEFKRGIADWEKSDAKAIKEDGELPPALSHIDAAPVSKGSASLSKLTEISDGDEEILPALTGQKETVDPPRDVMGDLFSPKTTPADELLDAIHLAELHGPGEQNPAAVLETAQGQEEGPGVKQFIPERGGKTPIPEIESRLDEFFNLDVTENTITELPEAKRDATETADPLLPSEIADDIEFEPDPVIAEPLPELDPEPEADLTSEFEKEIEPISEYSFESESDLTMEMLPDDGVELVEPAEYEEKEDIEHSFLVEDLKEDPAEPVLGRLKNILSEPSELTGDSIFTQVQEDLSQLGRLWETETDKIALIELLTGLSQYVHDLRDTTTQELPLEGSANEIDDRDTDDPLEGEVQETLFGEETISSEDKDLSEDEIALEGESSAEGNDLSEDEILQEREVEEDLFEENSLDVEETPKGFWAKIKSKFRK